MTEMERAAVALQLVNAASIKAADTAVVLEIQQWLKDMANGPRTADSEIPTLRDTA